VFLPAQAMAWINNTTTTVSTRPSTIVCAKESNGFFTSVPPWSSMFVAVLYGSPEPYSHR
jgi:hypothetical protein